MCERGKQGDRIWVMGAGATDDPDSPARECTLDRRHGHGQISIEGGDCNWHRRRGHSKYSYSAQCGERSTASQASG
jgi:hypothetical protein